MGGEACVAKGGMPGMGGGACVAGCVCGGGGWVHAWQGPCIAGEMATAADGTHPTGMHSCYYYEWFQKKSCTPPL